MQKRLSEGKLLDLNGSLNEAGFAFNLIKQYERKDIKGLKTRIKEWDYYYIGDDKYGLALTIADNSLYGMVSFSILDFVNKKEIVTSSALKMFTFGKWKLPSTSETGDLVVKSKKFSFEFYNKFGVRHLACYLKGKNGKDFSCDIKLCLTSQNSMVIATPFNKKKHFYYNQKINCMQVTNGSFTYGDLHYDYGSNALAVLDWGRGVWTYSNTWYWASLSSYYNGRKVGFNLGYGFGDTSAASENMAFIDADAIKLEDVEFIIPQTPNGKDDYLKPWKLVSKDNSINLTFEPFFDRYANMNLLVLQSIQHQVFGKFSGTIVKNNKKIEFKDCIGFAEKVKNRW